MTYLFLFIRRWMLEVGCSMFSFLFALCLCMMTQDCFATQWAKTYGGIGDVDKASSIQQTTDGGYIVFGQTNSFGVGLYDWWILKLASDGTVTWQKTLGGGAYEQSSNILQTMDGGYIVGGNESSFPAGGGYHDAWIIKLDSNGNITWQKSFGGTEQDRSIHPADPRWRLYCGGAYRIFWGWSYDLWILKLDSGGNVTWQKTYGGSDWDECRLHPADHRWRLYCGGLD